MYFNFHSHDTKVGTSSIDYVNYLEKENIHNENENNLELENQLLRESKFFNSEKDSENNFVGFDKDIVINDIDNNLASRSKSESNFYNIDIAPSQKELLHIQKIAEEECYRYGS